MHGLYAIVDTQFLGKRGLDPITFARAVLQARPAALQLRAKDLSARETLRMLRALAPICRAAGVKLVANDRADLAALAGCDAVHIGQEDLPYALVHRIAPQLGIGISTHDLEQLDKALAVKPLYVAFGPVYATASKPSPDPVVGLDGLAAAAARARAAAVPLVAIGGITFARAADIAAHADAWAVIADLCPEGASPAEITARARALDGAAGPPVSGESGPGPAGRLREAQ